MLSRLRTILRSFAHIPRALGEQAARQAEADARLRDDQDRLDEGMVQLEAQVEQLAARVIHDNEAINHRLVLALNDISLMAARQLEFQRENRLLLGALAGPGPDWRAPFPPAQRPPEGMVFDRCVICRQEHMASPLYPYWMGKIHFAPLWHRKRWEFLFICQALYERGMLAAGRRGLGFGVGEESLPAYFASEGCLITGTDMAPDQALAKGWVETEQHAAGLEALRRSYICPDPVFDANVDFRFCDMNAVPDDLTGFDFCWSACALEHLGSIEQGLAFIERSIDCLRPGGVAVHTTEYNLSSNDDTVGEGGTVLFRRRDLEVLSQRLAAKGHVMAPLDLEPGTGVLDAYLDLPPYRDEPQLKLALQGYACTSIGIIVTKAG